MRRDHRPHRALTGGHATHRVATPANPVTGSAGDDAVNPSARHRRRASAAGASPGWTAFHTNRLRGGSTPAPRPGAVRSPAGAEQGLPERDTAADPFPLAQIILFGVLRHIGAALVLLGLIVAGTVIVAWALIRKLAFVAFLLIADRPVGGGFEDDLF
jgi:hypothetical protein